jgi:hypothetical protein
LFPRKNIGKFLKLLFFFKGDERNVWVNLALALKWFAILFVKRIYSWRSRRRREWFGRVVLFCQMCRPYSKKIYRG